MTYYSIKSIYIYTYIHIYCIYIYICNIYVNYTITRVNYTNYENKLYETMQRKKEIEKD